MYQELFENLLVSEIKFVNTYAVDKSDYPMKNSGRYSCGFVYTIEGTEIYHFKDKTIEAKPNTLLFIPKGEKYKITLDSEKSVVIYMDFETTSPCNLRPFVFVETKNSLFKLFSSAKDVWINKKSNYKPLAMSYFYSILAVLSDTSRQYVSGENEEKIMLAVNYMHEHYTEPDFKTERLGELSKISQRYLQILFKKKYGISPKEYLINLRISLAKELLKGEKNKISDICYQVGFSDIYHFSKSFKNKTGYTPKEYIKQSKFL